MAIPRKRVKFLSREASIAIAFLGGSPLWASCAACGQDRSSFDELDAGPDVVEGAPPDPNGLDGGLLTICQISATRKYPLGCDYSLFTIKTDFDNCKGLLVSNPGSVPAHLKLRHGMREIDVAAFARKVKGVGNEPGWAPLTNATLDPGETAYVALTERDMSKVTTRSCPFAPVTDASAHVYEDQENWAFHLSADTPVFAIAFESYWVPYFLGVPADGVSAALRASGSWSDQYIDVGIFQGPRPRYQRDRENVNWDTDRWKAFVGVVAREPTRITLDSPSGPLTVDLDANKAHRFTRDDLFIGKTIRSEKPIALFVGAPLAFWPYGNPHGDPILSQVPPPGMWASEYAVVGHPPRHDTIPDPPIYRIVARENDTNLVFEPAPPVGAPQALQKGGIAVFRTEKPFVVRSQDNSHPFYVSVSMTGGNALCKKETPDDGGGFIYSDCPGDPELVTLPPPAEFAHRFAFATSPQFADTYLVLTRMRTDEGKFEDVTLDCAGIVTGWKALGTTGRYETTTLPLSRGKFEPQVFPGGTCRLGPHTMQSEGPFTGQLWGWSHEGADDRIEPPNDGGYASYGFALYGLHKNAATPPAR